MKRTFVILFLFAVAALVPLYTVDAGISPAIAAKREIRSRVNAKCDLESRDFTIAAGTVATDFEVQDLQGGVNCGTGMSIECKGWGIKTAAGRTVYRYERCPNRQANEEGGRLANLRLQPGEYTIYVDGGRGAYVVVTFNN
jgi:hypothetical protein